MNGVNKFPEQPRAFPSTSGDIFDDRPPVQMQGDPTAMTPDVAPQQPSNTSEAHPAATDAPHRITSPPLEVQSAADASYDRQHELARQRAATIAALQPGESVVVDMPGQGEVVYTRNFHNDQYGRAVYTQAPARSVPNQLPPRPQSVAPGYQPIVPNALPASYEGPYPGPQGMVDFGPKGGSSVDPSSPAAIGQPSAAHPNAGPDSEHTETEEVFSDPLRLKSRGKFTGIERSRPPEQPAKAVLAKSAPEEQNSAVTRSSKAAQPHPAQEDDRLDRSDDPTIILSPAEMSGGDDMTVLERAIESAPKKPNAGKETASTEITAPGAHAGAAAAAEHAQTAASPEEAPAIPGINPGVITSEMQIPDLDLNTPRLPYRRNNT